MKSKLMPPRRRGARLHAIIGGIGFAAVVAALLTFSLLATHPTDTRPSVGAGSSPVEASVEAATAPAILASGVVTRQSVTSWIGSADFPQVNGIQAKLTTWGAALSSGGTDFAPRAGTSSAEEIWVVAVSGDIVPEFGNMMPNSKTYTWGLFFYNAQTGAGDEEECGSGAAWPPGFGSITDMALSAS